MATLKLHGHEYYYEDHGPKDAPSIVLSPLVYTDTTVYEPIARILADDYRVITYDHRGLGRSEHTVSPSLESGAKDVAALIEQLGVGPCHFVGNCLGAYIGLQLAIRRSDLLKSCTLMGAVAEGESDETIKAMEGFVANIKKEGMKAGVNDFAKMWFGDTFRATKDPIQVSRREKWLSHIKHMKPEEMDSALQIFRRTDMSEELNKVHCAVLILAGDEDSPSNLEAYRRMAKALPAGEYKTIHHAGFALVIEQPEEVAENIRTFVGKVERHLKHQFKQAPLGFDARAM
ncbi:alpha/beta fold hydrolase [Bdellovibrio bacteriovorus]|uniref:Beta-ketoadipate enol-lactone hydrolase n=1 Tax=Bdellovibrio bacteriovorus TaxID=959 RepID=A0A1Z3N8D0_BDEBC|nr:alpha/beta hydrolase [Bdellovibrio bacteriovorus]ASD63705.1 beta-ketoadipate enol-lactone hydrolase [Bdellovibrio bacteriovorus]